MTIRNLYGRTTRRDGSPLYVMSDADRAALYALRDKWRDNALYGSGDDTLVVFLQQQDELREKQLGLSH